MMMVVPGGLTTEKHVHICLPHIMMHSTLGQEEVQVFFAPRGNKVSKSAAVCCMLCWKRR
jgi:hypothetical protein